LEHTPEKLAKYLDKSQAALYRLIWNRFLASQAAAAVYDSTRADIAAGRLTFRVTGSSLKFEGYLRIYGAVADEEDAESDGDEDKDRLLPPLAKGDTLELQKLIPRQRFSRAPAPYNEASLIKELEERGIGRPSTYAETVSTIQRRKYVQLKEKKFEPTLLGKIIARLLVKSFPDLLNAQFTADMESSLDRIEEGSASLTQTLTTFYEPFHTALVDAKRTMKNIRREGLPVAEYCPDCGKPVLLRAGRFGLFYGCSAYPVCAYTRNIAQEGERPEPVPTEHKCPQCDSVMMLVQGKAGPFLSCSRYPECKTAKPLTTGIICPECKEGEMAQRKTKRGKNFYSCVRFPACNFSMWYKPVKAKCPNPLCDSEVMEEHVTKRFGVTLHCPKCKSKHKESA
jgi:DNA topoisomerase-1